MRKFTDRTGEKYGRLTIVCFSHNSKGKTGQSRKHWLCQCQCGKQTTVAYNNLCSGNVKSCGCYHADRTRATHMTHGKTRTKEYRAWTAMWTRCTNDKFIGWRDYGGRGITVCDRWKSFENFYADMNDAPSKDHSIDRIRCNGNYEPGNCRWETKPVQAKNRRTPEMKFLMRVAKIGLFQEAA